MKVCLLVMWVTFLSAQIPGWPVQTQGPVVSSPAIADIDNDGKLEVVCGSFDGKIYAWNGEDGSNLWQVTTSSWIESSPLIIQGKTFVLSFDQRVYGLDGQGNNLSGWPILIGPGEGSPAAGNLLGDNLPEIVIGDWWNQAYGWDIFGNSLSGWPVNIASQVRGAVALADISGSESYEVIFGTDDILGDTIHLLYVFSASGNLLSPWPKRMPAALYASLAFADLDNDGKNEIICATENGWIYAFNEDTTQVSGFPVFTSATLLRSSPTIGDLDQNGNYEIVQGSYDGSVYIFKATGDIFCSPIYLGGELHSSPALANLDADTSLEITLGSKNGKIYAFNFDGTPIPGFPDSTRGEIWSSPAIADINGDGFLDIIVGSKDSCVYAFPTQKVCSPYEIIWAMFRYDPERSGRLSIPTGIQENQEVKLPLKFFLSSPFSNSLEILFSSKSASQLRLEIFNILGQKLIEVQIQGNATIPTTKLSSGIYLAKITLGDRSFFQKLVKIY